MNEGVHAGHGEDRGVDLLTVELQGGDAGGKRRTAVVADAVGLQEAQVALDEQAPGAAAGVTDGHPGLRVQDAGHDHGHLPGSVELPGALALAFRKFPQQILIRPAQDVGFDVIQA